MTSLTNSRGSIISQFPDSLKDLKDYYTHSCTIENVKIYNVDSIKIEKSAAKNEIHKGMTDEIICKFANIISANYTGFGQDTADDNDIFSRTVTIFKILRKKHNIALFKDELEDIKKYYSYDGNIDVITDASVKNYLSAKITSSQKKPDSYKELYMNKLNKVIKNDKSINVKDIIYLLLRGNRFKLYLTPDSVYNMIDEYDNLYSALVNNNTIQANFSSAKSFIYKKDSSLATGTDFFKFWRPQIIAGGKTQRPNELVFKLLDKERPLTQEDSEYITNLSQLSRASSARSPPGSPRSSMTGPLGSSLPSTGTISARANLEDLLNAAAATPAAGPAPAPPQRPPTVPIRQQPSNEQRPPADQPLSRAQSVRPSQSIIKYSEIINDTSKELQKNPIKADTANKFTLKQGKVANHLTKDTYTIRYFKIPNYKYPSVFIYFTDNYTKYDNTTTPKGLLSNNPIPAINTLTPNTTILSECLPKPCRYIEHQLPTDGTYYTYLLDDTKKEIVEITIEKISRSTKDICDEIKENNKNLMFNFHEIYDLIMKYQMDEFDKLSEIELLNYFNNNKNDRDKLDNLIAYLCKLILKLWVYCITTGNNLSTDYNSSITYQYLPELSFGLDTTQELNLYDFENFNTNMQYKYFNELTENGKVNVKSALQNIHNKLKYLFDESKLTDSNYADFIAKINSLDFDTFCDIFNVKEGSNNKYLYFCKIIGLPDSLLYKSIDLTSDKKFTRSVALGELLQKLADPTIYENFKRFYNEELKVKLPNLFDPQFNSKYVSQKEKTITRIPIETALSTLHRLLNISQTAEIKSNISEYKYIIDAIGKINFDDYVNKITDSDFNEKLLSDYKELLNAIDTVKETMLGMPKIYIKIGGAPVEDENKATIIIGRCPSNQTPQIDSSDNIHCNAIQRQKGGRYYNIKENDKSQITFIDYLQYCSDFIKGECNKINTINLMLSNSKLEIAKDKDGKIKVPYLYKIQQGFSYSELFLNNETNESTYNTHFKPIFESMKSINDLSYMIFAYGYSGTGKTHLLLNNKEINGKTDYGIIYQVINDKASGVESWSIVDVKEYLCNKADMIRTKEIPLDAIEIKDLLRDEQISNDAQKVTKLLQTIDEERRNNSSYKSIKWTPNNPNSSRSHLLIRLKLNFENGNNGYITIVDMGGSEDGDYIFKHISADPLETSGIDMSGLTADRFIEFYRQNVKIQRGENVSKPVQKGQYETYKKYIERFGNFVVYDKQYTEETINFINEFCTLYSKYIPSEYNGEYIKTTLSKLIDPIYNPIYNQYIKNNSDDSYGNYIIPENFYDKLQSLYDKVKSIIDNCNNDYSIDKIKSIIQFLEQKDSSGSGSINRTADFKYILYKFYRCLIYLTYTGKSNEIVYENGKYMLLNNYKPNSDIGAEKLSKLENFYSNNTSEQNRILNKIIFNNEATTGQEIAKYIFELAYEGFFINKTIAVIKKLYNNQIDINKAANIRDPFEKHFIYEFLIQSNDEDYIKSQNLQTKLILFGNIREDEVKVKDSINTLQFIDSLTAPPRTPKARSSTAFPSRQ